MNLRLEKSREINKKHRDEKCRMFKHIQRQTLKERQRRRDRVTVQKQRDRQTDRQTEIERQTERQTGRNRETEKMIERHEKVLAASALKPPGICIMLI